MATVLGLAMKITADASGLSRSLTPVDRALQRLGEQASASAALFDRFLGSTSGASAAQRQVATDIAFLTSALKTGQVTAQQFADEFAKIQAGARDSAAAFAEAASVTERFATAQEVQAQRLERLTQLYDLGALSLDTYVRASADAIGINDQAARAEQERATFAARAAQLQDQARTPLQRYDAEVQELVTHLNSSNLSQTQFNTLLNEATQRFVRAESAAKGYDAAVDSAGSRGNLGFAQLAGTLAILPGPIGNVAGRISGITSAAEGLNRVFASGGGIGQFGAAMAGLLNPTTLALGALAGLGAGAVAVGRNLVQLEGEVERLGQLADRLGVSFGFIQVLETAANQTGGSVEALGSSFTKFLRTVDDARDGGKNAAEAFRDLGLSAEDVRASNPEQLFTQAAQAIAEISDPARRAAAAVALFGKSGAELLPVFRQIGAAAADLERIGGAITDQQRADIEAFGDAMDRAGVAAQGLERQVTSGFARIGRSIADSVAESVGAINRFLQEQQKFNEASDLSRAEQGIGTLFEPIDQLRARLERAREAKELLANQPLAEFVASLGDVGDGAVQLNEELAKALQQASQFGTAGTDAVFGFAKSLEDISAAAEGTGLSEEQLARAVANSRQDFERQIDLLGREADAQKQAADAVKKAADDRVRAAERLIEADRQRADAFVRQNGLGNESEAAENLLAITRQIDEAETAIVQARAASDREAERAALRRLQILEQAQAAAQDTLDFGFNANDIQQAISGSREQIDAVISKVGEFSNASRDAAQNLQGELSDLGVTVDLSDLDNARRAIDGLNGDLANAGLSVDLGAIGDRYGQAGLAAGVEFQKGVEASRQQLEAKLIDPAQFDAAIQKQQDLFDDRLQQLGEIRDLELQIIEERATLEQERLEALRRASQNPLVLNDIRTQEGASELVRLATGREDPAIAEYRKQLDALRRLENKLDRLAAAPVDIRG